MCSTSSPLRLRRVSRASALTKRPPHADVNRLLEMSFESATAVPHVHKAERLARGVKVVDTDPVSNPGSTQGGAEWRVTEYQPKRKEPPPDLNPEGPNRGTPT